MKRIFAATISVLAVLMLATSTCQGAFPPAIWKKGDENAIFGHTFEEEYWTCPAKTVTATNGDNVTFSASYVNAYRVQAFLFALNMVENKNGTGFVPYQFFGLHYFTPENREVFIGAVLAFLMAFNDSYNGTGPGQNNLPDPGPETVYYVVPFGAADVVNKTYAPEVNALPVEKLGEGHYKFGMQYKNLYAFIVENFLISAWLRTGFIAKFSELSVTYEIRIDNKTGEVKAETWYTLGEVTELWGLFLGIPFKLNPHALPSTMGISVVHFVTVFTSKYVGAAGNSTGKTINTDITAPIGEDINLKVGDDSERAMKIGTRGTFDVINESSGAIIKKDQPAYNAIVSAKAIDLFLLLWQLGFSAGCMSIFGYALSEQAQKKYTGPANLLNKGLAWGNKDGFYAQPLWYAVSFPGWNGYRIVHDPVYTAYANMEPQEEKQAFNPGVVIVVMLVLIVAVVGIVLVVARRKRGE